MSSTVEVRREGLLEIERLLLRVKVGDAIEGGLKRKLLLRYGLRTGLKELRFTD